MDNIGQQLSTSERGGCVVIRHHATWIDFLEWKAMESAASPDASNGDLPPGVIGGEWCGINSGKRSSTGEGTASPHAGRRRSPFVSEEVEGNASPDGGQ